MAYYPYIGNNYNTYQQPTYTYTTQSTPTQNLPNIINVRSELEARNYPIAPGNSVTFKDDAQPYIYVKAQSYNPMEQPVFKKYRMIEEETDLDEMPEVAKKQTESWATKAELEDLRQEYAKLSDKVCLLRSAFNLFTDKEEGKDE